MRTYHVLGDLKASLEALCDCLSIPLIMVCSLTVPGQEGMRKEAQRDAEMLLLDFLASFSFLYKW